MLALQFSSMDKIGRRYPVHAYVAEWREYLGLTQEQVAQRIGCGTGTVSKKESRPHKIDMEWAAKFAQAFDLHPPERVFRPPPPKDPRKWDGRQQLNDVVDLVPEDRAEEAAAVLKVFAMSGRKR